MCIRDRSALSPFWIAFFRSIGVIRSFAFFSIFIPFLRPLLYFLNHGHSIAYFYNKSTLLSVSPHFIPHLALTLVFKYSIYFVYHYIFQYHFHPLSLSLPPFGRIIKISIKREVSLMHKDDQMTPKERAFALFAGKPVDRMPIKLFSPYIGMNFGASVSYTHLDVYKRQACNHRYSHSSN